MKKRFLALMVSMVLLLGMMPVFVTAEALPIENTESKTDNNASAAFYQKIHFYLGNEEHNTIDSLNELREGVDTLKNNEAKRALNTANKKVVQPIELVVQFESNFMSSPEYLNFSEERKELKTSEDVLEFRKQLNSFSKEYHSGLMNAKTASLSNISYDKIEVIDYSPFVVMTLSPSKLGTETLMTLAKRSDVKTVSVGRKAETVSDLSWYWTMNEINAYDIIENETYTGDGVKIGVYEIEGICDTGHANLSGANITVRDPSKTVDSHATNVTSILTQMAPQAEFFVSDVYQYGIAWFISQNCDVVNCSFSYSLATDENGDGIYEPESGAYHAAIDGIYDYQVAAHFITVVKSAGNVRTDSSKKSYNPNGVVCSPGKAYNVLTVGGADYAYIDDIEDHRWVSVENACYRCPVTMKPNVSAPFYVWIPNISQEFSGTSASTPVVTAAVSFLMEKDVQYTVNPQMVTAALMATADETYDYSSNSVNIFDNYVGAGVINIGKALESNLYYSRTLVDTTALYESTEQAVYLTAGDSLQATFAWLATAFDASGAAIPIDFEMYVYDPSGNLVASSTIFRTMVEMIKIDAAMTGTYRVVIMQDGSWYAASSGVPVSFYMNRIRP